MLKRVGLMGALATAVAVTVAATLGSTASAKTTATSPLCKTAGIGFAGPLTGPAGFLGQDQHHWVQLFLGYWNSGVKIAGVPTGLKRVKLKDVLDGDSQLNPQNAATVGAQMVSKKSILGMVGFAGSNENLGGGPVLDRAKLVYVSGSATTDNLTSKLKYFYRVVPNNSLQANAGAGYAIKALGLKSGDQVMVVDDGEAYGVGIADAAGKVFAARGVKIDRESLPESTSSGTADFTSLAQKAVAEKAKLVYAPTQVATDSQLFANQLKTAGYTGKFMATDGSFSPSQFNFPGAYVSFFGPPITSVAKSVVAAYTKKFGSKSANDPFGAPSFIAAEMIAIGISSACKTGHGKVTRAAVAKAVSKVKLTSSIFGHGIAFNNSGDVGRGPASGVTVFQIQSNGSYKLVSTG
jgi:ABC-type branched-subunit amino acid transport system substrate-binding protein